MKSTNSWGRVVAVAAVLLLMAGGSVSAQLQTGSLSGTVVNDQGAPLAGVKVTLSGSGPPLFQTTNSEGQFSYPTLDPGTYVAKAELEGYSTVDYPDISIAVGRNTEIEITMNPAIKEKTKEKTTVTIESPRLDTRRTSI